MKLYSAWYCPFAQRAWMALIHNKKEFKLIEVDPYKKTDEWMSISEGAGTVPVLKIGQGNEAETHTDSNGILHLINDDLEDEVVKWTIFINEEIIPYLYRFLQSQEEGEYRFDNKSKLIRGLHTFTEAINEEGPYFFGKEISSVDLSLIPFAYRIKLLLGHYRGFDITASGELGDKYHRWYDALVETDIFKNTSTGIEGYENKLLDLYKIYADGGGQTI